MQRCERDGKSKFFADGAWPFWRYAKKPIQKLQTAQAPQVDGGTPDQTLAQARYFDFGGVCVGGERNHWLHRDRACNLSAHQIGAEATREVGFKFSTPHDVCCGLARGCLAACIAGNQGEGCSVGLFAEFSPSDQGGEEAIEPL